VNNVSTDPKPPVAAFTPRVRTTKQKDKTMQIKTNGKTGFTLVEIMIVVAIIGLLAAIAIPNFVRARESAQLNSIANNLRILEGAKEQYALENKLATSFTVTEDMLLPYLKGNMAVKPVVAETYTIATVGDLIVANWAGSLAGKTSPATVTSF
jgi:prepilin-type N-terminal cleavage/methylation domain-containing protein